MKHFIIILLLLVLSGCSGGSNRSGQQSKATEDSPPEISLEMLQENPQEYILQLNKNRHKVKKLELIVGHNGVIYSQLAWGSLQEKGWRYVRGYGGLAIIDNSIIYMVITDTHTRELYCSDLDGGNETLIFSGINYDYVWIVGDRVLFASENEVTNQVSYRNVFCYDPSTSLVTKLSKEPLDQYFVFPISFDNHFVYYAKLSSSNDWRVRWDGSSDQEVPFRLQPMHWIDGDDYYFLDSGEFADEPTGIERISMETHTTIGEYRIQHGWLIRIEDGWIYYGDTPGIFKMNAKTGDVVHLAELAPGETWHALGFYVSCIIDNTLYFNTEVPDGSYGFYNLYQLPINGGEMEFLDVSWEFGGKPIPAQSSERLGNAPDEEKEIAMAAYKAVLLNESTFYDYYEKSERKISELGCEDIIDERQKQPSRFTIMDMNGDGTPEVVFDFDEIICGSYILHYEEGKVYGFHSSFFCEVYSNGISKETEGYAGVFFEYFKTISLNKNGYKVEKIAAQSYDRFETGKWSYYIGEKEVSEKEFEQFLKKQEENSAVWHEFTKENIHVKFQE